ncbi:unnamed protein product [Phytomonas sp. Hart1]|nr:unnamed protein product [Phytomonas sp. Hart1]|eukprot:CCW67075.1 unnamed protein product [Phytomonas sp. isolate Hart1]
MSGSRAKPPRAFFRADDLRRSLAVALDDDGEALVVGVDEAGRGPVFGPMVYAGAVIDLADHDRLVEECGVADSKVLTAGQRQEALRSLKRLKTFRSFVVVLTAEEISAAMTGCDGRNLNTLSHDAAITIISRATLAGVGKLCAAYVDTVGPPESYQSRLSGRFPHLDITVSAKADSKYPIVSAASIIAKTTRDEAIERLGLDIGSGYPSDPRAARWLRLHVHRFFIVPRWYNFVRYSWGPVAQLGKNPGVCIQATFKQDELNEEKKRPKSDLDKGQPKLDFARVPPKRAAIFTHMLMLEPIQSIDF